MNKTVALYAVVMLAAAIAVGLVVASRPDLSAAILPPIIWPLGASLLFDVIVMQLAARGRAEPLTMPVRLVGVLGAAMIVLLIGDFAAVSG